TYFTYIFGGEIARSLRRYLVGRQTVLDLGCGVGHLLPHICRYARCVYGADISDQSIARANARFSGTKAFAGAFTPTQLRSQQTRFDSIFVVEVIEHLYDEALDTLLADVRNLLAPGGVVIFTTPNDEILERNMILCPQTGEVFHRWQHVRSWNKSSLVKWLADGGFEPVEIVETNFALARPATPIELAKRIVKRILVGRPGKPHLVGVARL